MAGEVGVLAAVIQSQAETIREQAKTIDVLSGGRRLSLGLDQTIGEMWERHFASLPDVEWKKTVRGMMRRFVERFGEMRVADFGPRQWESFRDDPETRAVNGPTTLNNILARVKIMFNRAIEAGELHDNPLRSTKRLRGPAKRTTQVSEDAEAAIVDDLDPITAAMFVVALDSAMRRDEARLLQWPEIDFATRTIYLSAERTKNKTARTVYLTARAAKTLKSLPRYPGCAWVFANPKTLKPYSRTRTWDRFRAAVDDNGIQAARGDGAVRWHDATRRTAACRLIKRGAILPAVQRILGHTQLATTLGYISAEDRDVIEAHALLEKSARKGPQRAKSSDALTIRLSARRSSAAL